MSQSNSAKVSVLFIANLINFLVSFLLVPFLSRVCSYYEYGTYSQVLLFGTFCLVIFPLGIATISNVVLAENEKRSNEVFNTIFTILLFTAIVGVLLILFIGKQWNNIFNNPAFLTNLIYYIPVLVLQGISAYILNTLLYYNRVKIIAVIIISTNILKVGLFFLSLYVLQSMMAIYISLSIFTFLQCIFLFFSLPSDVRRLSFKYDKNIAKKLFTPAIPIMLTGLLGNGILYVNGIFISHMISVEAYAIYRNGAIEFPLVTVVTGSMLSVMMPAFAKLKAKEEINHMLEMKQRACLVAAALIFPVCIYLVFFSKEFIVLYLSDKYIESAVLFSVYNLALLIRFNNYQDILIVHKKTGKILLANIAAFLLTLLLNFVLIKYYGLLGAVTSFLLSLLLLAVLLTIFTCNELKIKVSAYQNWTQLFKILMVSIVCGFVFFMLYSIYQHILWLIIITIAYFTTIFIIFMKFHLIERTYVHKYMRKLTWINQYFFNTNKV